MAVCFLGLITDYLPAIAAVANVAIGSDRWPLPPPGLVAPSVIPPGLELLPLMPFTRFLTQLSMGIRSRRRLKPRNNAAALAAPEPDASELTRYIWAED